MRKARRDSSEIFRNYFYCCERIQRHIWSKHVSWHNLHSRLLSFQFMITLIVIKYYCTCHTLIVMAASECQYCSSNSRMLRSVYFPNVKTKYRFDIYARLSLFDIFAKLATDLCVEFKSSRKVSVLSNRCEFWILLHSIYLWTILLKNWPIALEVLQIECRLKCCC